jgi:putative transposase
MSRRHREDLPGAAFHIVTRTQGHANWLAPLRTQIVHHLEIGIAAAGARLIAAAVMPNHIHVLLFQGRNTLGTTMQPILRKAALLVQRLHRIEGHVFERRFRSRHCSDLTHLRNTILYIHRNPVAAGLCEDAARYDWSTHAAYLGLNPCGFVDVEAGRRIIACVGDDYKGDLRSSYAVAFEQYCSTKEGEAPPTLFTSSGDHRSMRYEPLTFVPQSREISLPDVRDAVLLWLKSMAVDCDIELLRSRYRVPRYVQVRSQLIATLIQRGYKDGDIAGYFRISISTVSKIRCAMRWDAWRKQHVESGR